jgi:hypothetical protein
MKYQMLIPALLMSTALFVSPASADTTVPNCSPQQVAYSNQSGGQVALTCDLTNYYYAAQGIAGTCSTMNKPADVVKLWLQLAQSALLSGKTINFDYVACGGYNWITKVTLNRW